MAPVLKNRQSLQRNLRVGRCRRRKTLVKTRGIPRSAAVHRGGGLDPLGSTVVRSRDKIIKEVYKTQQGFGASDINIKDGVRCDETESFGAQGTLKPILVRRRSTPH